MVMDAIQNALKYKSVFITLRKRLIKFLFFILKSNKVLFLKQTM